MLFYLGLEHVTEEEWKLRIRLVHLSDCTERIRLFHWMGNAEQVASLVPTAVSLRQRIEANPAFQLLPRKIQKELRTGDKATLFGKTEIVKRANEDPDEVLPFYRLISNYVHCMPFGFHRTGEHQRVGTENDVDKKNMALALDFASRWLSKALDGFEASFPDLVTFGRGRFDFGVLTRPAFAARDEALIARIFGRSRQ